MKKIFTLVAAVLFTASMFAAVETETINNEGAGTNVEIKKTSVTLPGNYDAGPSSALKGSENRGVKLRTQNTKIKLDEVEYGYAVITVNRGYAVRNIKLDGTSNSDGSITLYGVYADVDTAAANIAASVKASANKLAANVAFPNKNTEFLSTNTMTFDAEENILFLFAGSGDNQLRAIFTVGYERTATCTDPTIAWNVEPANGEVGATDFTASVNVPAGQTVTWESSVPAVATVENGTIHYVGFGVTTITAKYTYVGEDFCNIEASISKDILVPITYKEAGTNDKIWYYKDAVPAGSPDNGLTFASKQQGNGLFGVKLNSDGYAWFEKPAVKGTVRIGAYYMSGHPGAYDVNVFACNASGEKQGEALKVLSTSHAGAITETLEIAEDVAGLRFERSTGQEGILYFIEFREDGEATAIENTEAGVKAVKFFENGQLLIEKNGVIYNAQGTVIR